MARVDMKVPTDPMYKLLEGREPPHAAEHPDPRFRRPKGKNASQHYATVDRQGESYPPHDGNIPTPVNREAPWPERNMRREDAEIKRFQRERYEAETAADHRGAERTAERQKDEILDVLVKRSERLRHGKY